MKQYSRNTESITSPYPYQSLDFAIEALDVISSSGIKVNKALADVPGSSIKLASKDVALFTIWRYISETKSFTLRCVKNVQDETVVGKWVSFKSSGGLRFVDDESASLRLLLDSGKMSMVGSNMVLGYNNDGKVGLGFSRPLKINFIIPIDQRDTVKVKMYVRTASTNAEGKPLYDGFLQLADNGWIVASRNNEAMSTWPYSVFSLVRVRDSFAIRLVSENYYKNYYMYAQNDTGGNSGIAPFTSKAKASDPGASPADCTLWKFQDDSTLMCLDSEAVPGKTKNQLLSVTLGGKFYLYARNEGTEKLFLQVEEIPDKRQLKSIVFDNGSDEKKFDIKRWLDHSNKYDLMNPTF